MKIVSLHTNTWGCGIAKYNHVLAKLLSSDVVSLDTWYKSEEKFVIISIGLSEFSSDEVIKLNEFILNYRSRYILILHSLTSNAALMPVISKSSEIIVLNSQLQKELKSGNIESTLSYTPSLINLEQQIHNEEHFFDIFTFGMSHKHDFTRIEAFVNKLKAWGKYPRIKISSAIHIGSQPLDSLSFEIDELKSHLQIPISFLGFLSDEKLAEEIDKSRLVFRFFDSGIRSNNTTAMTALQHEKALVTNIDEHSPDWLSHGQNFVDISKMLIEEIEPNWPVIAANGKKSYHEFADWPKSIAQIKFSIENKLI